MSTVAASPYQAFKDLANAGWSKNFGVSVAGHLCVNVPGAPSLGGSPGDLIFFGAWTRSDGTTLMQRSNMDRSVTTIVLGPYGNILHRFKNSTLAESSDEIIKRGII